MQNKWDIKYIKTLSTLTQGATENIVKGLH